MSIAEIAAIYEGAKQETVSLAELDRSDIVIPEFQRDRIDRHIDKIAGEFDQTAYAFPLVAGWKGGFLCIDGQQRLAALERLGEEKCWVLLIEGIAKQERLADIFLKFNRDRKLLKPLEKYVGALGAKDPGTINLRNLVERDHGLVIDKSATSGGHLPVGALLKIQANYGLDVLDIVLRVREQAWGHESPKEANEAKTLLGLAEFFKRYEEKADIDRVIELLRKHHPGYILEAVDTGRATAKIKSYSDWVRDLYNKNKRGRARL